MIQNTKFYPLERRLFSSFHSYRLESKNVSFRKQWQESDEDDRKSARIASTIHPKFGDSGLP